MGAMPLDWEQAELAEGLRCYRAQEFFLAHEHWEGVWLRSGEPEKTFLQALIQISAAFHHLQRGNVIGTASLLRAALGRLDKFPEVFGGVAVAELRQNLHDWLEALETAISQPSLPFPCIR